jgi:hypothetical protein
VGWVLRRVVFVILLLLAIFWVRIGWNWLGGLRQQLAVGRALDRARIYSPPTTQHVAYDDDPRTYPLLLAQGTKGGLRIRIPHDRRQAVRRLRQSGLECLAPRRSRSPVFADGADLLSARADQSQRHTPRRRGAGLLPWRRIRSTGCSSSRRDGRPSDGACRSCRRTWSCTARSGAIVRVYDGQVDGNDRSHLCFVVEHNGQKIDVRGQLGDDGKVVLTPAAGQVDDFFRSWAGFRPA